MARYITTPSLLAAIALAATACGNGTDEGPAADPFGDQPLVTGKGDAVRSVDVLLMPANAEEDLADPSEWTDDDAKCFHANAEELATWYENLGCTATVVPVTTPESALEALDGFIASKRRFDRVIVMGHGNGNGPCFCCGYQPQIGYDYPDRSDHAGPTNIDMLELYGRKLHDVTDPSGWVYVGACNPGTSTSFPGLDTFLETLSCVTGRHTLGTSCKTACWDVKRRIQILEGPDRAFTPGLVRQDACEVSNGGDTVVCLPRDEALSCRGTSVDNAWGPCAVEGADGMCMDVDACTGTATPGYCPGPASIQCCVHDPVPEICDDGVDNDQDGSTDCDDDDCTLDAACECVPDCSGRVCGPDPVCGESCGVCPAGQACNPEGLCVVDETCDDDAFEDNDSREQAAPVTTGTTPGLSICPDDDDWYTLTTGPGILTVTITFTAALGDLDMKLFDAAGTELGGSAGSGDTETIETTLDAGQDVFIRVYGFSGARNDAYDLDIQLQ